MATFTKTAFIPFNNVTGTNGDDLILVDSNFNYQGGSINGAGGTDELRFNAVSAEVLILNTATISVEKFVIGTGTGASADTSGTVAAGINAAALSYAVSLTGNAGNNALTGGSAGDTLDGGSGNDTLLSGEGNDILTGGTGADTIQGGGGNDLFMITTAAEYTGDSLDGGTGTDELRFATATAETLVLNASTTGIESFVIGMGTGASAVTTGTVAAGINAAALSYAVSLTGNAGNNALTGGSGADTLNGGTGDDTLSGGAGDDLLTGGAGNDILWGGTGADIAVYSGQAADYGFGVDSQGNLTVTDLNAADGDDGTDALTGINTLRFADRDYALGPSGSGLEFQVNTYTTNAQSVPAVAVLADGSFLVAWASDGQDGSGNGVYAQRYAADGATLGNEFQVNTYTSGGQTAPAITALPGGGFLVAWESSGQDGSSNGVYAQRYAADGIPQGSEFRVNTYTTNSQAAPALTTLTDGGFVAVWTSSEQDNTGLSIYAQRYAANGTAQGSEFRVNTYAPNNQTSPTVTALTGGGFVVAWTSNNQDGSGTGIYAQRYAANGTVQSSEFRVNTYTDNDQTTPVVTPLPDGGFVVAWRSLGQDGSGNGIYAQRYAADATAQGGEFQVNSYTTGQQVNPAITSLADGGFLVAWDSFQDGSLRGIYAQRYAADGSAQGGEFRVNTTTADDQLNPAVTALPDGGFLVAWQSGGQDGSSSGIFAQRYDADGRAMGGLALTGTAGNDTFTPATLIPTASLPAGIVHYVLDGGTGIDTADYSRIEEIIRVNLSLQGSPQDTYGAGFETLKGIENLVGSLYGDILTGDGNANALDGRAGPDTLSGQGGADTLLGGEDADDLDGGDGDDFLGGGNDNDYLQGGNGNDLLYGDSGNDTLYGGNDNDLLYGGSGNDTLYGDSGNDRLYGEDGNDRLTGGGGNDTLDGGSGTNQLFGGLGDDTYDVHSSLDTVAENDNEGTDSVVSQITYVLPRAVENLALASTIAYRNDFDGNLTLGPGVGGSLSGVTTTESVQGYSTLGFSGDFLRNTSGGNPASATTLTLTNLPAHDGLDIDFLLALIDSWDGTSAPYGPDHFKVTVDGVTVLDISTTHNGAVLYNGVELGTVAQRGFNATWNDRAFDMAAEPLLSAIPHTASSATLRFFADGAGWSGGTDESWAIENLQVTLFSNLSGTGNDLANVLTGNEGNNVLSGGDGDDTLQGNGGNDTLDGGDGIDTAVFSGHRAAYTITPATGGTFQVIGPDGTDTLTGIEFLQFDDGTEAVPCFLRGTRILTRYGYVPVEELRAGDEVLTLNHDWQKVVWLGHRTIPKNAAGRFDLAILPIRIKREAFGAGLPASDLWVSPEHAVFFRDHLIPARHLVNGLTVVRDTAVESITYYHVLLERHAVVFSEGLPTESYVPQENMDLFENAASAPDQLRFGGVALLGTYRECFPRVTLGPMVETARVYLAAQQPSTVQDRAVA
jgi:Ca2+-binding RTX toxin-like protein